MTASLPARFEEVLTRKRWFASGCRILVACSGGADSTALLLLMISTRHVHGGEVLVMHCSHGLRGGEGDLDARFVADLSASLEVPFAFRSFDARELRWAEESLEQACRRLRYDSLLGLAEDLGEQCRIVTGHTVDDQAETVLLNLRRHSGRSRGGIRESRSDGVVRPLLGFRREELRSYLKSRGGSWREDSSNQAIQHARNEIRLVKLPQMERKWPGITGRLARAGTAWSERLSTIDQQIDRELEAQGLVCGGPLPRAVFRKHSLEFLGRLLVRSAGVLGRVPGKVQLQQVLERLKGPEESFEVRFGGLRLIASEWAISFLNAGKLTL